MGAELKQLLLYVRVFLPSAPFSTDKQTRPITGSAEAGASLWIKKCLTSQVPLSNQEWEGNTEMVKKTWIPKYQVPVGKPTHAFLANIMAATEAIVGLIGRKVLKR